MPTILFDSIIQIVVYVAILMIGTVSVIYLLGLFRANSLQQEHNRDKELNYFRELNDEGKLSDVEFRNIKERLSELIIEADKNNQKQKTGLFLNYDGTLSLLYGGVESCASNETQVIGCNECNNENGQAGYIETETKRMRNHDEDCGIDHKANLASGDDSEEYGNSTENNVDER
ncbi:MAG: hypothetical protein LBJ00_02770 [Planctomycetaceae bacterium]|jgi:hypothetical protein|nr:hypothetical protein [Planctomycetaceae bacterium]